MEKKKQNRVNLISVKKGETKEQFKKRALANLMKKGLIKPEKEQ